MERETFVDNAGSFFQQFKLDGRRQGGRADKAKEESERSESRAEAGEEDAAFFWRKRLNV